MKTLYFGVTVVGLVLCFAGCQNSAGAPRDNWLLVSFEKDVPVAYRMVSERTTEIDLTTSDPKKKSRPKTTAEKLELVMVYTPVEVDPFGLSTLNVECRSAKVTRTGFSGRQKTVDAMESLAGKSFALKISPTGDIVNDPDGLPRVAAELGKASFDSARQGTRIKNPDMINDFLTMQETLWTGSSAISNQLDLNIGDAWESRQPIAWPVPTYPPPTRTTTYTLDEIVEDPNAPDQPRKARISSTYALSETPLEEYIRPYEEGKFQMRGLFGFLRQFQFKHIKGSGSQVFNIDDGLVESDRQHYLLDVTARFMLPLGDSLPVLKVDQKIVIDRIEIPSD